MSTASPSAPGPAPSPSAPAALLAAWPRSAQLTAAFLIGALSSLLAVQALGSWRGKPSELERGALPAYRVDLNRADRAELLQLPGVGVALADRLENYRREHGAFRSVEELKQVRGVGPMTLERLRPWVYVRPADGQRAETAQQRAGGKKTDAIREPVDVNHASAEELQRLPRIGVKMAERIISERQKAPFRSVAELRRVPGIGPKTLELLRPFVTVGGEPREAVGKGES